MLIGIVFSTTLLVIAAINYPGGSQKNKNSVGYDWRNNYLCNLFSEKAMNGHDNPARPWAIAGMLFLCISFAIFFIGFSKKIQSKTSANLIKYCGAGSMLFAFLVITPYHDVMVTIACVLALIALFYSTVFVLLSKLFFFKILSIACMATLYASMYIYYTSTYLSLLPIMQKLSFLIAISWMLGLRYFTSPADFAQVKAAKKARATKL
jgi:hypothetical protein